MRGLLRWGHRILTGLGVGVVVGVVCEYVHHRGLAVRRGVL